MNGLGRGDEKKEKKFSVITRETVGMTLLLFSAIIFLIAVTGRLIFGDIGVAITSFFVGLLGFFVYPFLLLCVYLSFVLVSGKSLIPAGWIVKGVLLCVSVFFIVHTATAERFYGGGYGQYLSGCWNAAKNGAAGGTGGGIIFGLIAYPIGLLKAGAYVLYTLLVLLSLFYIFTATPLWHKLRNAPRKQKAPEEGPIDDADVYSGAVAFDDLEERRASAADIRSEALSYAPPQGHERGESAPAREPYYDTRAESRDILYGGDPASRYTENLIYDSNSRFNTTKRRSSVQYNSGATAPVPPAPPVQPAQSAQAAKPAQPSGNYSARYAAEAENTRPAMPRRVAGPDGYYSPDAAFDYPQAPSYRAPDSSGERKPFSEPLRTPVEETPVPPAPPVQPAQPHVEYTAPESDDDDGVTPFGDPRELPPLREPLRTETTDTNFSEPVRETPVMPSGRRTSLRDYLSRTSEEDKKTAPPLVSGTRPDPAPARPAPPVPPAPPVEEPTREEPPVAPPSRFGRDPFREREEEESDGSLSSEQNVFDSPAPRRERPSVADMFDDTEPEEEEEEVPSPRVRTGFTRGERVVPPEPAPAPAPAPVKREKYLEPAMDDLAVYDEKITVTDEEVEKNVTIILDTLKGFNVEAIYLNAKRGPAVTQYNIDIPRNVSVSTVIRRDAEIAMRLHAKNGINIYSNPQAEAISIEVPNATPAMVSMRTVMQAEEYVHAKPNRLVFTMGMSIEGNPVCGDITSMKHILMAGATGSGKSVMMNSMLISLLYKYSPEELRLILIDPKKVEFAIYEGIPHLMIREVISDEKKVVAALAWAVGEMERRYSLFEKKTKTGANVKEIDEYNANLNEGEEKLPRLVIVIDELADLMATVAKDIEVYIQRIAQKARAAGIHLVLATQRPSADIITGIIKANLPTRIAFHVAQEINSRIILDETGADKLLGNGDMLYKTEKMSACQRLQGVFISSKEVEAVIRDIKNNNRSYYDQSVDDYINNTRSSNGGGNDSDDEDANEEYIRALRFCVQLGQASISLIQRKCRVGYNHAGKIIEWMESKGYITPFDGKAKARTVLLTKEEFEELYGGLD